MKAELKPGLHHLQMLKVDRSLTVPALSSAFPSFADMPPVLATACLVGFMEWACIEALHPFLDEGEQTLGTHIDVSHVAPTPAGMMISAEVELMAVEGRKLRFKVSCRDEDGLIGEGFHERAVIDHARFMARVASKAQKSGTGRAAAG
jgi:fluoroacetyl-CoA thioesterase